jgi:hypothetical protein
MAEAKLQARVIKYAKGLGFLAKRNYNGPGVEVGWPDTELFLPGGRVLLFEFKDTGKEARKIQAYRIGQLRALGHHVFVCDNYSDAKAIIDAARATGAPPVGATPLPRARSRLPARARGGRAGAGSGAGKDVDRS